MGKQPHLLSFMAQDNPLGMDGQVSPTVELYNYYFCNM